jgi:hypothetical protein
MMAALKKWGFIFILLVEATLASVRVVNSSNHAEASEKKWKTR